MRTNNGAARGSGKSCLAGYRMCVHETLTLHIYRPDDLSLTVCLRTSEAAKY